MTHRPIAVSTQESTAIRLLPGELLWEQLTMTWGFWAPARQRPTHTKTMSYRCRCLTCSRARCRWASARSWSGWTDRNSCRMISPNPRAPRAAWHDPVTSQLDCRRLDPGLFRRRSHGGGGPFLSRTPGRDGMAAHRSPAGEGWSADLEMFGNC